jgi:hypothetical protein
VETFDALAPLSRQVSRSAQIPALSMSCQVTKQIPSVDFVLPCAPSGRLIGLYADDCTFNSDTVAESGFEIVNLTA